MTWAGIAGILGVWSGAHEQWLNAITQEPTAWLFNCVLGQFIERPCQASAPSPLKWGWYLQVEVQVKRVHVCQHLEQDPAPGKRMPPGSTHL